ncbi:MAG TPA: hypothetical protein VIS48_16750 [Candidatus Kryptonia bacterium]
MKTIKTIIACVALISITARAQQTAFQDSLLDKLAGKWILQGTIAGQETTHDISVEWVLNHEYLQIHEVSREKNAQGTPAYEAIVYIGWNQQTSQYQCLWLDVTGGGGLNGDAIGHAKQNGDEIPFLFISPDGSSFHTTFAYGLDTDTWKWIMDAEAGGKTQPFARLTLKKN